MAKRAHREGTIYQMKSGKWRAQISDPLGKRIGKVFDTQSACQDWIFETKSNMKKGIRLISGQQKLSVFVNKWLSSINASRSPNTINLYENTLKPVIDVMGRFSISDIHPTNIQALYGKLLDEGMSAYSVRAIHKTLSSAFGYAMQMRLVSENPLSFVTPPKHVTKKMKCFDASQVQTLLLGAQTIGDHYFPLYYLAINTGMRQGELLGLKWENINWEKSEISIDQ